MLARSEKPRFFYGYVIVIACFFMMVVWWGTFNTFGVFFESLLVEFGWTRAVTSIAFVLNGVIFGVFGVLIARLCDRFSPQVVIGVCGVIGGLGYTSLSQLSTVWQLYLIYGLAISIVMGAYIAVLPIVARWFVRRRGLMTGVVFSGMGVGTMVIPPITSRLIAAYGWQHSYVVIGIITLVGIVAGAQFLRRDPHQAGLLPYGENEVESESPGPDTSGVAYREALRTPQFWLVSGMYFVFLFCQLIITVHFVIHATGMGLPAINAADLLAIFGALLIVGLNVMGMAVDKFGGKFALIVSFALITVTFLLIILSEEIWMLYLFAVVAGFAAGGLQVIFSPVVAELFGMRSHGVIFASAMFLGGFGAAVGPVIAGYIFDVTGSYSLAFIICAIMTAIAFMMALLLRPLRSKGGIDR